MAVQTSYAQNMLPAFPGMKADLAPGYARSMAQGEASAEVPFGVAVAQGSADDTCILPSGSGAKIVGVALHSATYQPLYQLGTVGLKPKTTVNVMEKGTVWVTVEENVAKEDPVFIRHTAGAGGTQLGAFRKSADTASAIQQKGCRYLTSASAGGVAMVEVDFNVARNAA
jgi:hypothetical protein